MDAGPVPTEVGTGSAAMGLLLMVTNVGTNQCPSPVPEGAFLFM